MQTVTISAMRKTLYNGPVAIFIDANSATSASRFAATINWGDGTVTTGGVIGGDGYFVVTGAHSYRVIGTYTVDVSVSMSVPDAASARASGVATIISPALARARARLRARIARRGTKPN